MKSSQHIYNAEIRRCPRSPEWKTGALRGLEQAIDGIETQPSNYPSGSAQDDAWRAGFDYGLAAGGKEHR